MAKDKKLKPILIKGIGKRGKNPHINLNPTDDPKQDRYKRSLRERYLTEQPVTVKAKSSKTGRVIVKHFRTPEDAANHYHKWLTSGRLRNVQLATESSKTLSEVNSSTLKSYMAKSNVEMKKLGKMDYAFNSPESRKMRNRSSGFNRAKEKVLGSKYVKVHASKPEAIDAALKSQRTEYDKKKGVDSGVKSSVVGNIIYKGLKEKALSSDIPREIIQEVYVRGIKDWSEDKPMNQEQWAFSRVNSFIQGGRAFELDEDLISEAREYRITAKTTNKSLGRLAKRKDSLGRQARTELKRRLEARDASKFKNKATAKKKLENALAGKISLNHATAKKIITTLGLNPKSAIAKSLTSVANKHKKKKDEEKQIKKLVKSQEFLQNQKLRAKQMRARKAEDAKVKEENLRMKSIVDAVAIKLDDKIKPVIKDIEQVKAKIISRNEKNISNPPVRPYRMPSFDFKENQQKLQKLKPAPMDGLPANWGGPDLPKLRKLESGTEKKNMTSKLNGIFKYFGKKRKGEE